MGGSCRLNMRRRGILLFELVATMAAGIVVTSVAIAVLVTVVRLDRRLSIRVDARRAMDEFAERLRRDVHAAESAEWDADARELQLSSPDGEVIVYSAAADCWERRVRRGDDEQLSGAYRWPRNMECLVEIEESPAVALVTLKWVPRVEPHDPTRHKSMPLEIVAAVGRDLELLYQ